MKERKMQNTKKKEEEEKRNTGPFIPEKNKPVPHIKEKCKALIKCYTGPFIPENKKKKQGCPSHKRKNAKHE